MKQVVIENPIINSPFIGPARHFRFTDEGISDEIVDVRRISSYFIPIAPPKKKGRQLTFETEWLAERMKPNDELPNEKLSATFTEESKLPLSTADLPTRVENALIVGESSIHTLDDLKQRREQEVAFLLAKLVLEKYFRQDGAQHTTRETSHQFDSEVQAWLFPQVLNIANRWLRECVICKDNTFPQLLLLLAFAHDAADRIYRAIVRSQSGETTLLPIL